MTLLNQINQSDDKDSDSVVEFREGIDQCFLYTFHHELLS